MNFRAYLDSVHASNIYPPTVPQQAGRRRAWRMPWTLGFDRVVCFVLIAAIFGVAVRPKHPPLWRIKFVGLTAFGFLACTPRCCGR
jgi:hypothetical protein